MGVTEKSSRKRSIQGPTGHPILAHYINLILQRHLHVGSSQPNEIIVHIQVA